MTKKYTLRLLTFAFLIIASVCAFADARYALIYDFHSKLYTPIVGSTLGSAKVGKVPVEVWTFVGTDQTKMSGGFVGAVPFKLSDTTSIYAGYNVNWSAGNKIGGGPVLGLNLRF